MEVNTNNNVDATQRVIISSNKAPRPQPKSDSDSTEFYRVAALDQALQETPAVRPEAVAHAKALISEVRYPGDETIRGIASLLALKLDTAPES